MEKLAQAGNTYYIFDSKGDGMSFSFMGRVLSWVKYANVSLSLRSVQDVNMLSILGVAGSNKSDVYFDGMAGSVSYECFELSQKAKTLSNMGIVPLRIVRDEQPGLMQILYVIRPETVTRDEVSKLLGVTKWRVL